MSISAGASNRCGELVISVTPSLIIVPHDGLGGWTPAPRKESPASRRIEFAIISGRKTMIVVLRFGRSSVSMIRSPPALRMRAASTNSVSRNEITCPRIGFAT